MREKDLLWSGKTEEIMNRLWKKTCILFLLVCLFLTGCGRVKETAQSQENSTVSETESVSETATETEDESSVSEDSSESEIVESESETVSEMATDLVEAEETTVEEVEKIEYTVTQVEEVSMYATNAVNVRQGPSTDFERVGSLGYGQEVTVTGEASTGWYEIAYKEGKAFVSNNYLQSEPVPAAPSNSASVSATNIILIGDSRMAEMKNCVGENSCIWIAEHAKGIKWFVSDAVPAADPYITQGSKIIINLGANDPAKIDTYIYTLNEVVADWTSRGAIVYYATVGPCNQNPYHTNEEAVNFNAALMNGVGGVHWIDLYSYLVNNGFATREDDGFHYDTPTYGAIYAYYMSCIR